jgi:hypothetical protein
MRKWLLLTAVCCLSAATAQKKIALEALRFGTPINYLSDSASRNSFLAMLSAITDKRLHMPLTNTGKVQFIDINKDPAAAVVEANNPDTSLLHLYLAIAEYNPKIFFSAEPDAADSTMKKNARTVFRISYTVANAAKAVQQQESLDIVVSNSRSAGLGNESPLVFLLPKTFVELMRNALDRLLDPANTAGLVGLAVPPVYMADNYIMPKINGRPRTPVTQQKDIAAFDYAGKRQLLRQGEPLYEQIIYKGKRAKKYSDSLMQAIRTIPNDTEYDFVILRQECRDVVNDRNYLLKLATQVDPYKAYVTGAGLFTGFLPGKLHYLLGDKDTVASFSITGNLPAPKNKQYPASIYNGYDVASLVHVSNLNTEWPVVYAYYISGTIKGHEFDIYCGGVGKKLKEVYLDSKLVYIGQGWLSPDIFVIFDETLPPELFNQLTLIAFNRFLE